MKKKEKLKSPVSRKKYPIRPTKNSIGLSDLELKQVSGSPKFGFVPEGTGQWVDTFELHQAVGSDSALMSERVMWCDPRGPEVDGIFDNVNNCLDWVYD